MRGRDRMELECFKRKREEEKKVITEHKWAFLDDAGIAFPATRTKSEVICESGTGGGKLKST